MIFVTMSLVIFTLAPLTLSEDSNGTLPLDGLRTAIYVKKRGFWNSSAESCKKNYTDLVTIYDGSENKMLLALCTSYLGCYIGLKKGNDTFKWSNGDPYSYNKNPSNDTNICVAMKADGSWESVNCNNPKPFICYSDELVNYSRYHLIREQKNWYDALSYCRENFTDLVSIRNDEQNSEVLNKQKTQPNNCWIGLMRDSWEWSDKGLSSFRNWSVNTDFAKNTEQYVYFNQSNLSSWNISLENVVRHAICYKDHIHISNESMTWEESLNYCRSFNGSFCILTKHEQVAAERLMKRLNIAEPVWVGLEQNSLFGFWVWTTGVTVDWSNWEGGQRPRLPLSHHCGALRSAKDDFKWKDMNCRTKLRALCFDWIV